MKQSPRTLICLLISCCLVNFAQGDEPRPRVLILGDRVYQEPARTAAQELKDRVDVVFHPLKPGQVWNTDVALRELEQILGDKPWDLIHFNVGLGDLVYRAPQLKSFRAMSKRAGGVLTTSPAQYEQRLRMLVKRLRNTGAQLVWASTTPIRSSSHGIFEPGSERLYNDIAARIMEEHKVPIHDMFAQVQALIDMERANGADPFTFDKQPLHPFIVNAIVKHLSKPAEKAASR